MSVKRYSFDGEDAIVYPEPIEESQNPIDDTPVFTGERLYEWFQEIIDAWTGSTESEDE